MTTPSRHPDSYVTKEELKAIALLANFQKGHEPSLISFRIRKYIISEFANCIFISHVAQSDSTMRLLTYDLLDNVLLNEEHIKSGLVHELFRGSLS